jgi:hypothetical protein
MTAPPSLLPHFTDVILSDDELALVHGLLESVYTVQLALESGCHCFQCRQAKIDIAASIMSRTRQRFTDAHGLAAYERLIDRVKLLRDAGASE